MADEGWRRVLRITDSEIEQFDALRLQRLLALPERGEGVGC